MQRSLLDPNAVECEQQSDEPGRGSLDWAPPAESGATTGVQVLIRIRPSLPAEQGHSVCVETDGHNGLIVRQPHESQQMQFTYVAGRLTKQEDVFKVIGKATVENCLHGFNSSIFAYGQTGSGKTYTMIGQMPQNNGNLPKAAGLMPRIFRYLFKRISEVQEQMSAQKKQHHWLVRCSMLEIYCEEVRDLLQPTSTRLQLREDIRNGVFVEGLSEKVVQNDEEALQVLDRGLAGRQVAATAMNAASSRSHCVFTCHIESKVEEDGLCNVRTARLHLVDLAGSERLKAVEGVGGRVKETSSINCSLTMLGLVILRLTQKAKHIPYRDSKLTFLLKDSIGGNAKTAIIANISESTACLQETLSTLGFATRALKIVNKPVVNEDSSGDLAALRAENARLKKELVVTRNLLQEASLADLVEEAGTANPNGASLRSSQVGRLLQQPNWQLIRELEECSAQLENDNALQKAALEELKEERNALKRSCLSQEQELAALKVTLQQNTREIKKLQKRLFRGGSTGSIDTESDVMPGVDASGNSGQEILIQVLHQVAAVLHAYVPGAVGSYPEPLASASPYPTVAGTPGTEPPGASVEVGGSTAQAGPNVQQQEQEQKEQQQQQDVPGTPPYSISPSQNVEGLMLAREVLAQQGAVQASSIVHTILNTLQHLAAPLHLSGSVAAAAVTPAAAVTASTAAVCEQQISPRVQSQQTADPSTPNAPIDGSVWSKSPCAGVGSSTQRRGLLSSKGPVVLRSMLRTVQQELLADRRLLKDLAEENEVLRHKLAATGELAGGKGTADEVLSSSAPSSPTKGRRNAANRQASCPWVSGRCRDEGRDVDCRADPCVDQSMDRMQNVDLCLGSPTAGDLDPSGITMPLDLAMHSLTSSQPGPQPFQAPTASNLSEPQSSKSTLAGPYQTSPSPNTAIQGAITSYMNGVYELRSPPRLGEEDGLETAAVATATDSTSYHGQPSVQFRGLAEAQHEDGDGCDTSGICLHAEPAAYSIAGSTTSSMSSTRSEEELGSLVAARAAARIGHLERQNQELRQKVASMQDIMRDALSKGRACTPHSSAGGVNSGVHSPASCYSPVVTPQEEGDEEGESDSGWHRPGFTLQSSSSQPHSHRTSAHLLQEGSPSLTLLGPNPAAAVMEQLVAAGCSSGDSGGEGDAEIPASLSPPSPSPSPRPTSSSRSRFRSPTLASPPSAGSISLKAAELQETLERSIILSRSRARRSCQHLQQWSQSLCKSLDVDSGAAPRSKHKKAHRHSSHNSRSLELGDGPGLVQQHLYREQMQRGQQQQGQGQTAVSASSIDASQKVLGDEHMASSGWGGWAKRQRSRGKPAAIQRSSTGSESPMAGVLAPARRYFGNAAAEASVSCSSFSRSSFAGRSLRDSELLMSGEMQIGSVCASFRGDDGEVEVDSRLCHEAASDGEVTSSWGPSQPVTALPLQSINLSYPAGSTYITPRLLMMNPSRGSAEEHLQDDMCYMGADGDGSIADGEQDMGYSSSCTSRHELGSEGESQDGARCSMGGGSSDALYTHQQQQWGQHWGRSSQHPAGYKAAGSRVAEIMSEEEVLQGSPDLPDSGGAPAPAEQHSTSIFAPLPLAQDGSSAEVISGDSTSREELGAPLDFLKVAAGSSPDRSSTSRGRVRRSTQTSSCSSLPTPGQNKPCGWVRGSDGCSWGGDAAGAAVCSEQDTTCRQQWSLQLQQVEAADSNVPHQEGGQAADAAPGVVEHGGMSCVNYGAGRASSATLAVSDVLRLSRCLGDEKRPTRNSYSGPPTSTGASGPARSNVSIRVWRSSDLARASGEVGSASSTPGTVGPASPFSPQPPSWDVDRFKEENDLLMEQLQALHQQNTQLRSELNKRTHEMSSREELWEELQQLQEAEEHSRSALALQHVELVWVRGQLDGVLSINQDLVQMLVARDQALAQVQAQLPATSAEVLPQLQDQGQGALLPLGSVECGPTSEQGAGEASSKGLGLEGLSDVQAAGSRCSEDAALLGRLTPVSAGVKLSRSSDKTPVTAVVQEQSSSSCAHSSDSVYSRSSAGSSDSEWQEANSAFGQLVQATERLQSSMTDTGLQDRQRQQLEQQLLSTSLKVSRRQQRLERHPWRSKSPVKQRRQQQCPAGLSTPWGRGGLSSSMPELSSDSIEGLSGYMGALQQPTPAQCAGYVEAVSYELGLEGEPRQLSPAGPAVTDDGHSWSVGADQLPSASCVSDVIVGEDDRGKASSSRSSSSSASAVDIMHEMLQRLQALVAEDVQDSSSLMAASAQLTEAHPDPQPEGLPGFGVDARMEIDSSGSEHPVGGAGERAEAGTGGGVVAASKLQVASARKLAAAQGSLAMMRVLESLTSELQDLGAREESRGKHKGSRKGHRLHDGQDVVTQNSTPSSGQGVVAARAAGSVEAAPMGSAAAGDGHLQQRGTLVDQSHAGGPGTPPGCIPRSLIECFDNVGAVSGARGLDLTSAAEAAEATAGTGNEAGTTSTTCAMANMPLEQLIQQQQLELDGIMQLVAVAGDAAAANELMEELHRELQSLRVQNMELLQQLAQLVYVQQQLRQELTAAQMQLQQQQAMQGIQRMVGEGRKQQQQLGQVVEAWDPLLGLGGAEVSERTLDVWEQEYTRKVLVGRGVDGNRSCDQGRGAGALVGEVKLICQVVGVGEEERVYVRFLACGGQMNDWDDAEDQPMKEGMGNAEGQQQPTQLDELMVAGVSGASEDRAVALVQGQGTGGGKQLQRQQQSASKDQGQQPVHQSLCIEGDGDQGLHQSRQQQRLDEQMCMLAVPLRESVSVGEVRGESEEWQEFRQQLLVRQEQLEQQQAQLEVQLQAKQQELEEQCQVQQQLDADLVAAQTQLQQEQMALLAALERALQLQQEKEQLLQQCDHLEQSKVTAEEHCSSYQQQLVSIQEQHSKQLAQLEQEGLLREGALEQQIAALQEQHREQQQQQQEEMERQVVVVNELQDRLNKAEMRVMDLQMRLKVSDEFKRQAQLKLGQQIHCSRSSGTEDGSTDRVLDQYRNLQQKYLEQAKQISSLQAALTAASFTAAPVPAPSSAARGTAARGLTSPLSHGNPLGPSLAGARTPRGRPPLIPSPGLPHLTGTYDSGAGRGLLSPTGSRLLSPTGLTQAGGRVPPPWALESGNGGSSSSRTGFGSRCAGSSSSKQQQGPWGMAAIAESDRPMSPASTVSDLGACGRLPWRDAISPRGSVADSDLGIPARRCAPGTVAVLSGTQAASQAPSHCGSVAGLGSCDGGQKDQDCRGGDGQKGVEGESSIVDAALSLLSPGGPGLVGFASRRSSCSSIGHTQDLQLGDRRGSITGEGVVGMSSTPLLLSPRLGAHHRSSNSIGSIASPGLGVGFGPQQGFEHTFSSNSSFASLPGCKPLCAGVGYEGSSSAGRGWGARGGMGGPKSAPNPFQKFSAAVRNAGKDIPPVNE